MKKEKTFVILKPDAVQRSLMGEIIHRLERTGLKFIAFKFIVPTKEQCYSHYNKDDKWFLEKGTRVLNDRQTKGLPIDKTATEYGKEINEGNVRLLTSGPVLLIVLEGNQAAGIVRKIVGGTEPLTSDVGTIRGDLTIDSYMLAGTDGRAVRNLIHCSESAEEAEREIPIWFKKEELMDYRLLNEAILYDVNLDGILE